MRLTIYKGDFLSDEPEPRTMNPVSENPLDDLLVVETDAQQLIAAVNAAVAGQPQSIRIAFRTRDGREVPVDCQVRAVGPDGGSVIVVSGQRTDILGSLYRTAGAGGVDAVTGLADRRQFERRLEAAWREVRGPGTPFAVLFIDLDGFKAVNDRVGHLAGDRVLREIALRLSRAVRPGDLAARFGGDEFVVLLENVSSEADAVRIAQRITSQIEMPLDLEGQPLVVTASIGIALSSASFVRPDEMLAAADEAMYRAKRSGPRHSWQLAVGGQKTDYGPRTTDYGRWK